MINKYIMHTNAMCWCSNITGGPPSQDMKRLDDVFNWLAIPDMQNQLQARFGNQGLQIPRYWF